MKVCRWVLASMFWSVGGCLGLIVCFGSLVGGWVLVGR